jgi:hypothetical protein
MGWIKTARAIYEVIHMNQLETVEENIKRRSESGYGWRDEPINLKNVWPETSRMKEFTRYNDVVIISSTGNYNDRYWYAKRSDIVDPLFWNQPFNEEWMDMLKEQLAAL